MAIERNLPENTERQLLNVQADVATLNTCLEFATKAAIPRLQTFAADETTIHAIRVAQRLIECELAYARRLEASAYRIYCETNGLDPEEEC
jgi:hypothetical protein